MAREEDFKVDVSKLHLNRKPGVSGMMRVKNDAEFIEACIESCIDALDELVIVYNDCTDNSPAIIKKMAAQYPDKIKYYEYLPWLYCGSLTKEQYEAAKALPHDSVHLLSNYYNYALSKTTRKYVMKIDADQIYFKERLKNICNLYRNFKLHIPNVYELYSFIKINLKYRNRYNGNIKYKDFINYEKIMSSLICIFGIPTSYSGINIIFNKSGQSMVPLGLETIKLNILMPFNGNGDHLIFKVKPETMFVPYDCPEYNIQTSSKYTYIEVLKGTGRFYLNGFLWWHLNGVRKNNYLNQLYNVANYSNSFMSLHEYLNNEGQNISTRVKSKLFTKRNQANFYINYNLNKPTNNDLNILISFKNEYLKTLNI